MKAKASKQDRSTCIKKCEAEFMRYTARKPVGGSEVLRVCREACPPEPPEEKQPVE